MILIIKRVVLASVLVLLSISAFAQKKWVKNGEWYFSWGYNKEWYTKSTIHVDQPNLNSSYAFQRVSANDHIGWDQLFQHDLSIPQYNYRLGYFFNEKQDWGIEINFDHTKYVVEQGSTVNIKGKVAGMAVDTNVVINDKILLYQLNNGANFLLFNIVKRTNIHTSKSENYRLDFLGKLGIGPVIPHVENTILGNKNTPHFQFGGWNTGFEMALRAVFYKHYYIEYANKIDYASYSGLRIYQGTAKQDFICYQLILSAGVCFGGGKIGKTTN